MTQRFTITGLRVACHRKHDIFTRMPQRPTRLRSREVRTQAIGCGEFFRRDGSAVVGQVAGRGDDHHARGTQLAWHQVRVFQRAGAYGHVRTLLKDVDDLIGQHDVRRHIGMTVQERILDQEVGDR